MVSSHSCGALVFVWLVPLPRHPSYDNVRVLSTRFGQESYSIVCMMVMMMIMMMSTMMMMIVIITVVVMTYVDDYDDDYMIVVL